jgi:hypothetical protein
MKTGCRSYLGTIWRIQEDDLLSKELQEGSADQKKAFGRLNIGLVRYSELVVH